MRLGRAAEEHAVGQHAGQGAPRLQVVQHVQQEGEVGLGLGRQLAGRAETVVRALGGAGLPVCTEGWVGHDGLKWCIIQVLWALQRVLVLDVELPVVHIVHDHVHAAQVEGSGVHLLPVDGAHVQHFPLHAQQQGAAAAGGVVHVLQPLLAGGDDARQHGAHLLRGVEFAGLLARAAGELGDQVLVGIAQHIVGGVVQLEVHRGQGAQHTYDHRVLVRLALTQLAAGQVQVLEQVGEVVLALVALGAFADVVEHLGELVQDEGGFAIFVILLGHHVLEELLGLQEIAELVHAQVTHGVQVGLAVGGAGRDLVVGDAVRVQDLVGIEFHLLAEVLVEDEAEDVVAKVVRAHLAAQGVGDVPEGGFEFLLGGHGSSVGFGWLGGLGLFRGAAGGLWPRGLWLRGRASGKAIRLGGWQAIGLIGLIAKQAFGQGDVGLAAFVGELDASTPAPAALQQALGLQALAGREVVQLRPAGQFHGLAIAHATSLFGEEFEELLFGWGHGFVGGALKLGECSQVFHL